MLELACDSLERTLIIPGRGNILTEISIGCVLSSLVNVC